MNIKIDKDVYDIANRIKYIDRDYFIVFNTRNCNFEVHNFSQIDSTYCLTLPFDVLDERTLRYVESTQTKFSESILAKLQIDNISQENASIQRVLLEFNDCLKDLKIN